MSVKRYRPGVVRDAVLGQIRDRGGEASLKDILDGVRAVLGAEVPASSVRSSLQLQNEVVRTGRGTYALRGSIPR